MLAPTIRIQEACRHYKDAVADETRANRIKCSRCIRYVFCWSLRGCAFICAVDEDSPAFWDDVKRQGWLYVNHTQEQTQNRFGEWYPPLIDTIIQSMAVGFVGTEDSTFSLVSQRRVEDWAGGVALNVNVQNGR